MLGLAVLLLTIFASRYVNERGVATLSKDEAETLSERLAWYRRLSVGSIIAIIVLYFVLVIAVYGDAKPVFPIFAGILVVYALLGTAYVFYKCKKLGINDNYINLHLLGAAIQFLGFLVYFWVIK
ncbi:MAG: hypothetical protein R2684_14840 [Pyrinomonadaceae bacterium]